MQIYVASLDVCHICVPRVGVTVAVCFEKISRSTENKTSRVSTDFRLVGLLLIRHILPLSYKGFVQQTFNLYLINRYYIVVK